MEINIKCFPQLKPGPEEEAEPAQNPKSVDEDKVNDGLEQNDLNEALEHSKDETEYCTIAEPKQLAVDNVYVNI